MMTSKPTEYTISYYLEVFRAGEKTNHFVSVKCAIEDGVTLEDLPLIQLDAKLAVSRACIYDALVSGAITVDDAKERIEILKENISQLRKTLSKKQISTDNG
jgi:predicted DNA-binding protein YlxM (UPF0122 family)